MNQQRSRRFRNAKDNEIAVGFLLLNLCEFRAVLFYLIYNVLN
jgi:hypothetical protein